MKIGVRAHDYGKKLPTELFTSIAKDGWKTVQLAIPKAIEGIDSFDDVSPEIVSEIKTAMSISGVGVAVLGVYVDPSLTDEPKRKEQVKYLLQALPQAKMLGAGCVGTETSVRGEHADIKALYRSLEDILPEAERLDVNLAIEPVHRHTLYTPELARQVLRDFSSPNLKIIFDPLNLLTPEIISTQDELWKRCFDCFGDHIVAIHIKGATRELDSNGMLTDTPFKSSILDYKAVFAKIKDINTPILREGAVPAEAANDIEFIKTTLHKSGIKAPPVHNPI